MKRMNTTQLFSGLLILDSAIGVAISYRAENFDFLVRFILTFTAGIVGLLTGSHLRKLRHEKALQKALHE